MPYALLADLTVLLHFGFILFVLSGGLLVLWKRRIVWLHVPTAIYGMLVEWLGWICPLTPMENYFHLLAGEAGYAGGFVAHYLLPIIYPANLTPTVQWWLGGVVLVLNVGIYAVIFWPTAKKRNAR